MKDDTDTPAEPFTVGEAGTTMEMCLLLLLLEGPVELLVGFGLAMCSLCGAM